MLIIFLSSSMTKSNTFRDIRDKRWYWYYAHLDMLIIFLSSFMTKSNTFRDIRDKRWYWAIMIIFTNSAVSDTRAHRQIKKSHQVGPTYPHMLVNIDVS